MEADSVDRASGPCFSKMVKDEATGIGAFFCLITAEIYLDNMSFPFLCFFVYLKYKYNQYEQIYHIILLLTRLFPIPHATRLKEIVTS